MHRCANQGLRLPEFHSLRVSWGSEDIPQIPCKFKNKKLRRCPEATLLDLPSVSRRDHHTWESCVHATDPSTTFAEVTGGRTE